MAKLTDQTADASPTTDDIMYTVTDPGGTPASRKVTLANLWNLLVGTTETITTGFANTVYDIGTVTTGTTTLAFADGNYQKLTNNGAFTLAPPASGEGSIVLEIINAASAGAVTTSGFSSVSGDALDTTNANRFLCSVVKIGTESYLIVNANSGNV